MFFLNFELTKTNYTHIHNKIGDIKIPKLGAQSCSSGPDHSASHKSPGKSHKNPAQNEISKRGIPPDALLYHPILILLKPE